MCFLRVLCLFLSLTLVVSPCIASSKDRLISAIKFEGLNHVTEQLVQNNIQATVGEPYDAAVVEGDVYTLTRLGEFKYISADVVLQEDGSVELVYTFREQQIITQVSVVGNTLMSDQELLSLVPEMEGLGRDQHTIEQGRSAIMDLYKELGNYLVEVVPEITVYGSDVDPSSRLQVEESVVLTYKIIEDPRVRFKDTSFDGNHSFSDKELAATIDTNILVPSGQRGKLNEQVLDACDLGLKRFYMNKGFLDVRVSHKYKMKPDNKEAQIVFAIREGPKYTIGEISISFKTVNDLVPSFSEEQIRRLLPLKVGDVYVPTKVNEAIEVLENAYGVIGRTIDSTAVRYRPEPGATVGVLFSIEEIVSPKVGLVEIKGNELTEDHVIRGRIGLKPGHPFNVQEAKRSVSRLRKTGLFNKVTYMIQPENPNNPGFRDVLFEVSEMNTSSMKFGLVVGSDTGIMFNFNINLPTDVSPTRTANEILDAINTRGVDQQANSPLLLLERAWLAVSQIRTKLLHEEINKDELRKRIDEMIGWIMSADDPANLEGRFAAAKPLERDFDAERLALLGVAMTFAEAVNDVALAKKSLDFSFVIMNNLDSKQQKYCFPYLIAGWLKPVHQIKDSTVCDEVFADLQSWLVNDSDLFQPEHLPWLDFAHVYVLSLRRLPNDAFAALPSLKSSVPDEPLFLLLQPPLFSKYRRPGPYTSQLSQRWVFDTIHALIRYSLATEVKEKEQSIELLGLQFDEFPIELSDDLLSRLMKLKLPPITNFDKMESDDAKQLIVLGVLLQEIKTRVFEDNISDARSFLDLVLSEEFQSKVKKLLEPITSEGNLR